jgi:dihydrofolate reductase
MSKVYTGASMSLDGYISGPGNTGFEHLFAWNMNGDVELPTANPEMTFRMTEQSHRHFQEILDMTGALVVGRGLWDFTGAWGGRHPMDKKVVVLTHNVPDGWERDGDSFVFVTEGIEAAVATARDIAGDKGVGLNSGTVASQALNAGLLDEVWIDLVPVLLGGGTPFFSQLSQAPVKLEGPYSVVEGEEVTHLRYRVVR